MTTHETKDEPNRTNHVLRREPEAINPITRNPTIAMNMNNVLYGKASDHIIRTTSVRQPTNGEYHLIEVEQISCLQDRRINYTIPTMKQTTDSIIDFNTGI